ncbi:MAG: element excision factor XisH family protein [Hormoscilla sp.]
MAKDRFHNYVKVALEKDGWTIPIVFAFLPPYMRKYSDFAVG